MSLTKTLFSFYGEIGRKKYVFGMMLSLLIALFMAFLPTFIVSLTGSAEPVFRILFAAMYLSAVIFFIYTVLSLSSKRLRHIGSSPWMVLLLLIPLIKLFLLVYMLFYPGKKNKNPELEGQPV